MRAILKKGVTNEQIQNAIKWAKEAGMFVTVSVILGYPGEPARPCRRRLTSLASLSRMMLALPRHTLPRNPPPRNRSGEGLAYVSGLENLQHNEPHLRRSSPTGKRNRRYAPTVLQQILQPRLHPAPSQQGYFHGNLYSKIMTRTAINYNLWRLCPRSTAKQRPIYFSLS